MVGVDLAQFLQCAVGIATYLRCELGALKCFVDLQSRTIAHLLVRLREVLAFFLHVAVAFLPIGQDVVMPAFVEGCDNRCECRTQQRIRCLFW